MSGRRLRCRTHGAQRTTYMCRHIPEGHSEKKLVGFNWICDDDGYLCAICDACEGLSDDDGVLPSGYAVDVIRVVCRTCFLQFGEPYGITLAQVEHAEAGHTMQ